MRTTVLLSGVVALVSAAPAAMVDKAASGSKTTIVEARGEPKDGNWHIGCDKVDKHHRDTCSYYQGAGPVHARGEYTSAYADHTSSKSHSEYKSSSHSSTKHKTTSEHTSTKSKYTPTYSKSTPAYSESTPYWSEYAPSASYERRGEYKPPPYTSTYVGFESSSSSSSSYPAYGSSSTYHAHESPSSTYSGHKSSSTPYPEYDSSSIHSKHTKTKSYGHDDYKPTYDRRGNYTEPKHTAYQPPAYPSSYPVYNPPVHTSIYTPPAPHTSIYSPPAYTSSYTPPVSVYSPPYNPPAYVSSYTPPAPHSSVYMPPYTPPPHLSSYTPPASSTYAPPAPHSSKYSPPASHSSKYTPPYTPSIHKSTYSSPSPSAYTPPGHTSSYAKHVSTASSYSGYTTKSSSKPYATPHSVYTTPVKPTAAPVCNFAESECIDCNEHPEACSTCNFMFKCGEKKQCTYFGIGEAMTMCKETAEECERPCEDNSDDGFDMLDMTDAEIAECLRDPEACYFNAPDGIQDFLDRVYEQGGKLCKAIDYENPFCQVFYPQEEDKDDKTDSKPEYKPHADRPAHEDEKPEHPKDYDDKPKDHDDKPKDHEDKPKHPQAPEPVDYPEAPKPEDNPETPADDTAIPKGPHGPDGKKKVTNSKPN